MARLAELNARSSGQAPAPRAPAAAAVPATPVHADSVVPTQAASSTRSVASAVSAAAVSTPPAGAGDETEAVDLYLDLPRASAAPVGDAARAETAQEMASEAALPGASAPADARLQWTAPDAAVSAAAPQRLARLGPYAIGAAALAFGVAVAGGAWLWHRSGQDPQVPSPLVRPPADGRPAQLGAPATDDPTRASQSPPSPTAPSPPQAARSPERSGASGTAPRRGEGVDAAADAALAAAERALAAQARQTPPGTGPAARPRPSAASATGTGTSP